MKFRRHIPFVILLLILLGVSLPANSTDFLKDCVKGFDFGGTSGVKAVEVLPVNAVCHRRCETECGHLSRKSQTNPDIEGSGIELNEGPILDCMSNCRKGVDTEYLIRQDYSTSNTQDIKYTKVSIGAICDPSNFKIASKTYDPGESGNNVQHSKFMVSKGDKVFISLANSEQKVFLCGKKAKNFEPLIQSTDVNVWTRGGQQNIWSSKDQHVCFHNMSDSDWNDLTNRKLWEVATVGDMSVNSNPCRWHARNPYYMDTGIYVQDGDELSIAFGGDYAPANWLTRKIMFDRLMDPNANHSRLDLYFERTGRIHVKKPGNSLSSFETDTIFGEKARPYADVDYVGAIKEIGKKVDTTYLYGPDRPDTMNWNGLEGFAYDINVKTRVVDHFMCKTQVERDTNYNLCHETTDPGKSRYVFSGTLSGFSNDRTLLAFKHHDDLNRDVYPDNIGGDSVAITWSGCPYENGKRLQYTIYNAEAWKGTNWNEVNWVDLTPTDLLGEDPIDIGNTGELVFRIIPLNAPKGIPDDAKLLYSPNNYFGSYHLFVSKPDDSGYINRAGPMRAIVKRIFSTLYGEPGKMKTVTTTERVRINNRPTGGFFGGLIDFFKPKYKNVVTETLVPDIGIVGQMYDTLVKDSQLINSVLALCVLYLTFVGIGFILGTVEMKQEDLIMKVFKVAVVIAVVSPGSTELFYENFLSKFVYAGVQLIAIIATGSLKNTAGLNLEMINKDPTLMFVIFDGLWTQFAETKIWIKIGTLFFYGFMGAFMAFLVLMSIVFYSIAVLKAALSYMMSLVIISILLFATPFFVAMMLFQGTRHIFDTWWKMIISYLIQPAGLFAGLAIFNTLFAGALYSALAFTVCPYCFLLFKIPFTDFCLIPWWQPMYRTFEPDGVQASMFSTPAGSFETIFLLLIISQAMMYYVDFITKVIGSIVSGMLTSRSTDLSSYAGQATHMAASAVGTSMKAPVKYQQAKSGALNWAQKAKESMNKGQTKR